MGCFCIDSDHDIGKLGSEYVVTLKTKQKCVECGDFILPGIEHSRIKFSRENGSYEYDDICPECNEIRKAFFCGSYCVGVLFEDIISHFENQGWDIDTCCLDGLSLKAVEHFEKNVLDRFPFTYEYPPHYGFWWCWDKASKDILFCSIGHCRNDGEKSINVVFTSLGKVNKNFSVKSLSELSKDYFSWCLAREPRQSNPVK